MPTTNQLYQNNNINRATSNVQANVNNVQPINQQFTQPMQQQPTNSQGPANVISAPTNLQTINNTQQVPQEQYNVPTPVEYQQPQQQAQNNASIQNVYDNYQSQYRNSVQFPNIDIQIDNANSIEGQFKSNYSDALNQLVSTLTKSYASYNYDPNNDDLLKQATKFTTQNTYESMNARGILNSSLTAERVTQVVGELIPQYEKMAREEFEASITRLINVANLLGNMSDREFAYWQDARDQKWKEEERDYQRKLDAIEQAWQRVDELGYVDNESAVVLGVAAGTLSKDAREAKEAYEREIAEWNRQHEIEKQTEKELLELKQQLEKDMYSYQSSIEMQNEKDLYNFKSNLDKQNEKELYDYKSNLDAQREKDLYEYKSNLEKQAEKELYEYKSKLEQQIEKELYDYKSNQELNSYEKQLQIQQKYGNSTSSNSSSSSNKTETVSLSNYEDVIKNKYAEQDMNNKWIISDNNGAYEYIRRENEAGRMSDNTAQLLLDKYGIKAPVTYNDKYKIIAIRTSDGMVSIDLKNQNFTREQVLAWGKKYGVDLTEYIQGL